ncbi:MAG: YajQ family cyclic di-GMP-binding protein [Candidatus Aminicenantes bacterium]|nr:YajQ family cyclic di-GMP-binding protein [Candidatus Aminicenantes bacterium]
MAQEYSFDIVSNINLQEVSNAVQVALKEIRNRFDFKHSRAEIIPEKDKLTLVADDEYKLRSLKDVLEHKMVKRRVPLKALNYQKIERGFNRTVKQEVLYQNGIPSEKSREIVKLIKKEKFKAQVAIQGDQLRVSSKKKDILQEIMSFLKETDLGINMQFTNYR